MALTTARTRYVVDLPNLQACCELNYLRLMRLLPAMRESTQGSCIGLGHSQDNQLLRLTVLERNPYTSTLELSQSPLLSWLPTPRLKVQVYHDAKMAEVIEAHYAKRLLGRYGYPNAQMHQPDEKTQLNHFLGECLAHGLAQGHLYESPVYLPLPGRFS